MSDSPAPQLNELATALGELTWSEVTNMAVQLGMNHSKLKQIQETNSELSDRVLRAMATWLDTDQKASWDKIVQALKNIDKNVLASKLKQKYCFNANSANVSSVLLPTSPPDSASPSVALLSCSETQSPYPPSDTAHATYSFTSARRPSQFYSRSCRRKSRMSSSPALSYKHKNRISSYRGHFLKHKRKISSNHISATQPHKLPGWQPNTRESRIRRVAQEASELQTQFVSVLGHAKFCFFKKESERDYFLQKFSTMLTTLPVSNKFEHLTFLKDKKQSIEEAKSVSEVFELLDNHWDFTDFALLEHLIKLYGDDEAKEMIKKYRCDLEEFEKRTTVEDFQEVRGNEKELPTNFVEVLFKLGKSPSECTLYEIRCVMDAVVNKACLESYSKQVRRRRVNSVFVTLALPHNAIELLTPVLDRDFLAAHNIESVTIGGEQILEYLKEHEGVETCGVQLRDSHKCSYRRRPMSYDIPYLEQDSDQVYEFRVRVKDRGGNTRRSCSYDYLDVMGPVTVDEPDAHGGSGVATSGLVTVREARRLSFDESELEFMDPEPLGVRRRTYGRRTKSFDRHTALRRCESLNSLDLLSHATEQEVLHGSLHSLHSAASEEELDREQLDRDQDQQIKDAELHDAFPVNVISMDQVAGVSVEVSQEQSTGYIGLVAGAMVPTCKCISEEDCPHTSFWEGEVTEDGNILLTVHLKDGGMEKRKDTFPQESSMIISEEVMENKVCKMTSCAVFTQPF